jgi:hypothetical protein
MTQLSDVSGRAPRRTGLSISRTVLGIVLAIAVAGCSNVPLGVDMGDSEFTLAALPTADFVLFEDEPRTFDAGVEVKSAYVVGQALATVTPIKLRMFASEAKPSKGCIKIPFSKYLACDKDHYESIGVLVIPDKKSHAFRLEGGVIARGINGKKLWFGTRLISGRLGTGSVYLTKMSARLGLF